ncbi:MAG: hypothetical protein RLZZ416_675 [Candidatus Parcubacteria bacterium]|jgi:addiction module RelE/StbE family toxin
MRIVYERPFERQYKKLSRGLQDKIWERFKLLTLHPIHPLLNDHKLNPPYVGYRSINVTGDMRLIYKKDGAQTYYLRAVGTHHQLFGT